MSYPCNRCNMDDGSPVCLQDQRCHNMPPMDATLRAAARRSAKIIRPEPDCRTCAHLRDETACAVSLWGCANADRYEPLPPVRLWRTT